MVNVLHITMLLAAQPLHTFHMTNTLPLPIAIATVLAEVKAGLEKRALGLQLPGALVTETF